jgi:hypothetical protein
VWARSSETGGITSIYPQTGFRLTPFCRSLTVSAGLAESIEGFCQRIRPGLEQASFEQKRHWVELLTDRVMVTGTEVEIHHVLPTSPAGEKNYFSHLRPLYRAGPARSQVAFYPMLRFKSFSSAQQFCHSFDALWNYFWPRRSPNEFVSLAKRAQTERLRGYADTLDVRRSS